MFRGDFENEVQAVPGAGGLAVVGEDAQLFVEEVARLYEFERKAKARELVLLDELPPAKYFALPSIEEMVLP
jgi:hypothetical protein